MSSEVDAKKLNLHHHNFIQLPLTNDLSSNHHYHPLGAQVLPLRLLLKADACHLSLSIAVNRHSFLASQSLKIYTRSNSRFSLRWSIRRIGSWWPGGWRLTPDPRSSRWVKRLCCSGRGFSPEGSSPTSWKRCLLSSPLLYRHY